NDSATLRMTAGGGGYDDVAHQDVAVTVSDNDTRGLSLDPTSLSITEGGDDRFEVMLTTQPSGNVKVTLSQAGGAGSDVTVDTDDSASGDQNELTFTTADWNQAQTVTVKTGQDNDLANDVETLTLTASGADYAGVSDTLRVTVTDDDAAGLTVSPNDLTITEGSSKSFAVKLSMQPSANVTVNLTQSTNADVKADTDTGAAGNQTSLTFTTGNWSTAQRVTVSVAHDPDAANEDGGSISLTATGGGYNNITGSVSVSVNDDDTPSLNLPLAAVSIEEGESGAFEVSLATQPSASVTITLTQPTNSDVTVDTDTGTAGNQTSLTFTTSNWNTPRRVRVNAGHDDNDRNDSAIIRLTASGGDYDNLTGSVTIEVEDDDRTGGGLPPPTLVISGTPVIVNEGSSATFTVSLSRQPDADDVTVRLAQPTNGDITVDRSALTFTADDWDEAQTIRVSAAHDADATDDSASIALTAAGAEYRNIRATVSIRVNDDDSEPPPPSRSFVISGSPVSVEEGSSAVFSVMLVVRPRANVTVVVNRAANPDVTTTPERLFFTPSNWNITQAVSVFADHDNDAENETTSVLLQASGGGYDGATRSVSISVNDDDTYLAGLVLSARSLTLNEGSSKSFTVRLATRPSANVKVDFPQSSNTDVTVDTDRTVFGNQSSLIFTPESWNAPRTVVVSAIRDGDAIDDRADISLRVSGGGYNGIIENIQVSVIDSDSSPGLILSPSQNLTVTEGERATLTVRLTTRPSADVTLALTPPPIDDVKVDTDPSREGYQTRLVFTPSNWNRVQAVVVIAEDDKDHIDERTSMSIAASGASEYSDVSVQFTIFTIEPDAELSWTAKSVVPAIPPVSAQDTASIRIHCKEDDQACDVFLDCTAQEGTIYRGRVDPISPRGSIALSLSDIAVIVGGDWSGKGRLLCSLRSSQDISGQIWTRSGDGVLVNNSERLKSVEVSDTQGRTRHRMDIESIPSPDDMNLSNIRIRCSGEADCTDMLFECYTDDGTLYEGRLGFVGRNHTRHLQTEELSRIIEYRWSGMGLTCEVGADNPFSVQILTRTGGGGALVNNSASGGSGGN
nr:hypothetical protein [Ectothiorhodospiraceae bacterium AqS1]